ncbi:MAG TPA: biotin--[acetyl-CoA-carboxylase] ligase [Egibacteraceae bacterium]|nr:biotin--[acetyl-CoA-carboxylase] ligase [Egibacteraceae bacterium]
MSAEESSQAGPPPQLVRTLVEGPAPVASLEWHAEVDSTNVRAAELARAGAPEIAVVGAEHQSAGRGRMGRVWSAPPRSSLTFSLLLRPPVAAEALPLLPLLAGLALAEVAGRYCTQVEVGLKWPNDLLIDGRKAAGVLVESAEAGAVVVGIGLNTDWRGIERWDELADAISLAEASQFPIDRWRVLAALLGVFAQRYEVFKDLPAAFLDGYRARCLTIGRAVRVERVAGEPLLGEAVGVDASGALEVRDAAGTLHRLSAGDVHHLR